MCGIMGYVKLEGCEIDDRQLWKNVKYLLEELQWRGKDATGIAYRKGEQTMVCKAPITAKKFVADEQFRKLKQNMPTLFIAHTRQATQGSPQDNRNNHPIYSKENGWAVVHNGIIYNDKVLFSKYGLHRDADVDSEIILKLFEHKYSITKSAVESAKSIISEIDGSLTFAFLTDDKIILYGNGGRVHIAYDEQQKVIYFSQDNDSLRKVLSGKKVMNYFTIRTGDIREIDDDEILFLSNRGILKYEAPKRETTVYGYANQQYWGWGRGRTDDETKEDKGFTVGSKAGEFVQIGQVAQAVLDKENENKDSEVRCPINYFKYCETYPEMTITQAKESGYCNKCVQDIMESYD
jgi:glucosamine 6-phosphate synthetase-like amidotransferase/phosphosugar isomerase protein